MGMVVNDVSKKREPDSYFYYSKESDDRSQNSPLKKQVSLSNTDV
ncbi:hypothetical protein RintRC_3031 [Richelia intracellularis]|nr:hypothetical protein RintRC_3031 [Richelia intracellularis]